MPLFSARRALVCCAVSALALAAAAGCTTPPNFSSDTPSVVTITTVIRSAQEDGAGKASPQLSVDESPYPKVSAAYLDILADPAAIPLTDPQAVGIPTGDYSYTVGDVSEDGIPDLLLRIGIDDGTQSDLSYVKVIVANPDGKQFDVLDRVLPDGTSSDRVSWQVFRPDQGKFGIALRGSLAYSSMRDSRFRQEGNTLVSMQSSLASSPLAPSEFCAVDWRDISDTSLAISLDPGACVNTLTL